MQFSKPFEDEYIWEFDGLEIPEYDFSKYIGDTINNTVTVMKDPVYSKRTKYSKRDMINIPEYENVRSQVKTIVEMIQKDVNSDTLFSTDANTQTKSLLYFIDTWNMKDYDLDFIVDRKGFTMSYHIDHRNVKLNLFVNLKDNKDSTEFMLLNQYNPNAHLFGFKPDCRNWQGPTHKGSGYMFFNSPSIWHKIDVTEDERHFGMMGVNIT
jgi:hypothetical protein